MRRAHTEIMLDILEVIDEGYHVPTRIWQIANLNLVPWNRYKDELIALYLIEERQEGRYCRYYLTDKGAHCLKHWREVKFDLGLSK